MLLPFDISPSNDQCEAMKRWLREFVILENRFKRTAFSPVIQLHFREPVCVEGGRSLLPGRVEESVFGNEEKLGLRVNEASNEPGAGNPVDFDITARNPLHRNLPQAYFAVTFRSSKYVTESAL